jgi:hypothetical protein
MRMLRCLGAATLILFLVAPEAWAAAKAGASPVRHAPRRAAAIIDNSAHMDANNLDMFVTNHGSFAWDLQTGNAGLIYPKGSTKTAIFAAGLWIGATVGSDTLATVAEYSQEYAPGPMLNGTFQSDNSRFKCYRINRGDDATTNPDYANWPVEDGAPVDSLGNPLLLGDATIWSVYNDADPSLHTNEAGSTAPLGVEVQQTTFAYNRAGTLGNIIFMKFKILNKGANTLNNTYVSVWCDPDLGGADDDLVGCDTTLSLGYCYNATNDDQLYGATPPAVGFDFFRGPIVQVSPGVYDTLGMTSFNKYINGTDPSSNIQTYNYMQGLNADGTPVVDPTLPPPGYTKFQVPGDPVANTGWLDTNPSDRRMMLTTGPFTMDVGDSQEVVVALIVGQGTDRLSSITDLKAKDAVAQLVFNLNFDIPIPPPAPTVYIQPLDKAVRLVWDRKAVGTNSENLSLNQDFHFEGFRVWQLPSLGGTATAKVIATYDEIDSVGAIYSDVFNSSKGATERLLEVAGKNEGLKFSTEVSQDAFRGGPLINNKQYYFAVTAYSFDVNNTVPFTIGVNQLGYISEVLESALNVYPAIPKGSNAIETVEATQTVGDPIGGRVSVAQLSLNQLADSLYQVTLAPDQTWSLTAVAAGDTLLANQTNISGDYDYPIVRGFMPRVIGPTDPARIYQLTSTGAHYDLANGGLDSSGIFTIDNFVDQTDITWYNFDDATFHDYEIRILPDTTEYAWEYNGGDPSPVATFKVPFEVWDLGSCTYGDTTDDVKVSVEVRDDDGDGKYSFGDGENTGTDRIYIRDIPYASVSWTTPGTTSDTYSPDDETFGRIAFVKKDPNYTANAPPPERIVIRGGQFCGGDAFQFRILPVGSGPGTYVGNDVKKILAVPNPYYAHSQYELTQFDRVLKFTNIPASRRVTIRIFDLAGDLVRTIRRDATTQDQMAKAEITWDLLTDNRLPVASGVYIYHVDVEGIGSKTDRLAVFVERERLDNY